MRPIMLTGLGADAFAPMATAERNPVASSPLLIARLRYVAAPDQFTSRDIHFRPHQPQQRATTRTLQRHILVCASLVATVRETRTNDSLSTPRHDRQTRLRHLHPRRVNDEQILSRPATRLKRIDRENQVFIASTSTARFNLLIPCIHK